MIGSHRSSTAMPSLKVSSLRLLLGASCTHGCIAVHLGRVRRGSAVVDESRALGFSSLAISCRPSLELAHLARSCWVPCSPHMADTRHL